MIRVESSIGGEVLWFDSNTTGVVVRVVIKFESPETTIVSLKWESLCLATSGDVITVLADAWDFEFTAVAVASSQRLSAIVVIAAVVGLDFMADNSALVRDDWGRLLMFRSFCSCWRLNISSMLFRCAGLWLDELKCRVLLPLWARICSIEESESVRSSQRRWRSV